MAKVLLRVPTSTANAVTQLELGLKSFEHRICIQKIKFIIRSKFGKGDCQATSECIQKASLMNRKYVDNINWLLSGINRKFDDITEEDVKNLEEFFKQRTLEELSKMKSLRLMPIPIRWWSIPEWTCEAEWSRMLLKFRVMNVGLGNRDHYFSRYAVFIDGGRIVDCPLCLNRKNDEIHLLTECRGG